MVTGDYLTVQDDWAITRPGYFDYESDEDRESLKALRLNATGFDRKNNIECVQAYRDSLKATAELVLVTDESSASYNGSSLVHGWISGGGLSWEGTTMWICSADMPEGHNRHCSEEWVRSFQGDWKFKIWPRDGNNRGIEKTVTIDHCLMGETADRKCGLHYNFHILLLIMIFNAIDTGIIWFIAKLHKRDKDPTLVLLGDAIAYSLKKQRRFRSPQKPSRTR